MSEPENSVKVARGTAGQHGCYEGFACELLIAKSVITKAEFKKRGSGRRTRPF